METNRLRQFCVVAETLNLRKAAEVLNISHAGLYKSLKALELELKFPLFRKEGRGILLSDQGLKFYPRVQKFLEQYEQMMSPTEFSAPGLTIGTFEVFSTYLFSQKLLPELIGQPVSVRELTPGPLEKAILNSEVDVGITYEPLPLQGLSILPITKFKMGIFGSKGKFESQPFLQWPFAAPAIPVNSVISGARGLDGWPDHELPRNIQYKLDMMETALQLCSEGAAVGFFPHFVVDLYNETRRKQLKLTELPSPQKLKSVKREIYLVLRETSEESSSIKKIAKVLRKTCTHL